MEDQDRRIYPPDRDSVDSPYCPKCGAFVKWGDRWDHYMEHQKKKKSKEPKK